MPSPERPEQPLPARAPARVRRERAILELNLVVRRWCTGSTVAGADHRAAAELAAQHLPAELRGAATTL